MIISYTLDNRTNRVIRIELKPCGAADELFLTHLLPALTEGKVTTTSSVGEHVYSDGLKPESDDDE